MIRRYCPAILIALLLFLPACSQKQEKKPPIPPIKVEVAPVEKGDIEQTLYVSGPLTFVANTTVSAEVSAQVQSLLVEDGQPVDERQVLLIFDETKIRATANHAEATLKKDEATLAFNKAEWEKHVELIKSGSISQTTYDQKLSSYQTSLAQVNADKAALAKALEDLKKTRVLCPIKGILSKRYIEKGDWVAEGMNLFQISDYSKVYLEAFISDVDLGKLDIKKVARGGIDAQFTVDSYPGKEFLGRLTYIQPVASEGRLFQIRIYLDNPEMLLLQGMFARGRIVFKTISNVLRVPLSALLDQVRNNYGNSVVVMDSEKNARLQRIKIGLSNRRWAEVVEGLNDGDIVVTRGKEILTNGQPLEATEMRRPS